MARKLKYTKKGRAFISKHIRKHRHYGMPMSQAVAAALSEARHKGFKTPRGRR